MNLRDIKYIKLWMEDIALTHGIIFNISDSMHNVWNYTNTLRWLTAVIENHQYANGHY